MISLFSLNSYSSLYCFFRDFLSVSLFSIRTENILDFDILMQMAEEGDHRNMDVLVSDIYEGRTRKLGLTEDLIAGSFGKV